MRSKTMTKQSWDGYADKRFQEPRGWALAWDGWALADNERQRGQHQVAPGRNGKDK